MRLPIAPADRIEDGNTRFRPCLTKAGSIVAEAEGARAIVARIRGTLRVRLTSPWCRGAGIVTAVAVRIRGKMIGQAIDHRAKRLASFEASVAIRIHGHRARSAKDLRARLTGIVAGIPIAIDGNASGLA